MVIERVVEKKGVKESVQPLVPGYTERLKPNAFLRGLKTSFNGSVDEVHIDLLTDDDLEIRFQKTDNYGNVIGKVSRTPLSKHDINEHRIEKKKFGGRMIYFRWRRSHAQLDKDQEAAVTQMVTDGIITQDQVAGVVDKLIEQQQRNYKG